jgi:hypothetical protein
MREGRALPWDLLLYDLLGAALLAVGIMALIGIDFGYPVLLKVAPVLIVMGILLMVPLIVWAVRAAQRKS